MLVDLTKQFHRLAKTSSTPDPPCRSAYDRSEFLDHSSRTLHELLTIASKLHSLGTLILKYGSLNKQQSLINKEFIQLKESLRETQKKVKHCLALPCDLKTSRELRNKFKEQIGFILECKLLSCSLTYKRQYEIKMEKQSSLLTRRHDLQDDDARFSKSTFLDESREQIMERERLQEYQEIEKGMVQITETYKSMVEIVRMQELMVGAIGENTEIAYDNILEGRRNLSEVNEGEKGNRRFIVKVFLVLYVFVFIYINILL